LTDLCRSFAPNYPTAISFQDPSNGFLAISKGRFLSIRNGCSTSLKERSVTLGFRYLTGSFICVQGLCVPAQAAPFCSGAAFPCLC
jgi:hypothetical protein